MANEGDDRGGHRSIDESCLIGDIVNEICDTCQRCVPLCGTE